MDTTRLQFPWFGVGLIATGLVMLLYRLGVVHFSWHAALWGILALFGAYKLVNAFRTGSTGPAFWGTIFLILGGYQTLENLDVAYISSYLLFPWTVVAVGVGFLMMFVVKPRNWNVLVPATFFLFAGGMMILSELGYFNRWDVVEALRQYWPIALILFGITLLLNRKISA